MYYGVSICLVSFASGLSVVTLNIYHRGVRGTKVPTIVKALVLGKLAKLLLLEFESRDTRERNSIVSFFFCKKKKIVPRYLTLL